MNELSNNIYPPIDRSYYRGMAVDYCQQMMGQNAVVNSIKNDLESASNHISRSTRLREAYNSISDEEMIALFSGIQSSINSNINKLHLYMLGL